MPVSLAHMAANAKSITFPVGGDGSTCTVVYAPGKINDAILTRLDTDLPARNAALCEIISSWDVFEDEAQSVPFPLDAARLAELPIEFKSLLVRAIVSDLRPN